MADKSISLAQVYEGWEGYNRSIIRAIDGRTREELIWKPDGRVQSAGEIARHIAFGRIDWFARMGAPGSAELSKEAATVSAEEVAQDAAQIVTWLSKSWSMIENVLNTWTVDDLAVTYEHEYWGDIYAISRQWTIWRIMAHDIQHGGQLTMLMYLQGIAIPELGDLGGHLTEPPIVRKA